MVKMYINISWYNVEFSTNAETGVFFVLFLRFGYTARAVSVCYDLYTKKEKPSIRERLAEAKRECSERPPH